MMKKCGEITDDRVSLTWDDFAFNINEMYSSDIESESINIKITLFALITIFSK